MSKFWSRTFDKVSENEVYEKAFEKHFRDKKMKGNWIFGRNNHGIYI
jgi:hypothetical protein